MISASIVVEGKTMADVVEAVELGLRLIREGGQIGGKREDRFNVSISRSGEADDETPSDGLTDGGE